MTCAVRFEARAARQLRAIEAYLADAATPAVAARFADGVVAFCQITLSRYPYRGRSRDDLRPGLRVLGYRRRVAVTYTVDDDERVVSILGVFYGGQDWQAAEAGM